MAFAVSKPTFKCPDPSQWKFRAKSICNDSEKYICLFDENGQMDAEFCGSWPDFENPGYKQILLGGTTRKPCSEYRYQPFTFWTNGSSKCVYKKTSCSREGQVIYNNGTALSDRTCRCDYTNNYDFLVKPRNNCFCVPTVEDCSCYVKPCPVGSLLTPDYKCLAESKWKLSFFSCSEINKDSIDDKKKEMSTIISKYGYETSSGLQEKAITTWRKRQENFEITEAYKQVLNTMKTNGFVILSGPPGSGKSAIAYNTAFMLEQNEKYQILSVLFPEEIRKYLLPETKQVFIIDDPVGKYSVDDLLALLVIQDNDIDRQILSLENQTTKELLNDICNECGFKYFPSTTVILETLNHLIGTYVQETDVGFACIHDTLFQNFSFIVGSSIIHCLLKYGNCTFIANRLQLASIQQKHHELVIMVKQEQEDIYFQRLVLDIRKGHHSHVFTGMQMQFSQFRTKLLTFLESLKAEDLTCDQNNSTPLHVVSENGYEDLVFKLFQLRKEHINLQDKNKRTPLFMACLGCHNKVIQTLLALDNSSLHVANNEDLTPFDIASINDDVSTLTILHRYGAKVNRKDEKINRTALQRACDNGSYNAVTFLLTKNANVKHKDSNGLKAIHIACSKGHLKIVELLLNHDKNMINECDTTGKTPLLPLVKAINKI
ncbi:unnamed protein product [Mytilus edulis]|uniref:Novel STAND NTPase 3 domain-containing protein n=1 Tax=Mytilus edulis TaxID=6550 RepID=A0A8S3RT47_MYTED|nr:unnamed protein product [Mytilus edulis]